MDAIEKINRQRRRWLYISSIIFAIIIGYIVTLQMFTDPRHNIIWWAISSILLIVSINWWYWTMHIINTLLINQREQHALIQDMVTELKELYEKYYQSK